MAMDVKHRGGQAVQVAVGLQKGEGGHLTDRWGSSLGIHSRKMKDRKGDIEKEERGSKREKEKLKKDKTIQGHTEEKLEAGLNTVNS